MRELTVQAANDTNVSKDRLAIAKEIYALTSEITRIGEQTEFNTMKLLDGSFDKKKLQVGANEAQQLGISIKSMTANGIGITDATVGKVIASSPASTAADDITAVLSIMDKALENVSAQRSDLGAIQNRLEHTIANADNVAENLTAAESRIRDVDMAKEMVQFSKNNILQQAGQSMLAQANQSTQGVLSLLQ
jgi:flagellin